MPKDENTPPLPTTGHHTEDGSYVESPSIQRGSSQEPPVNSDSNFPSKNMNSLPEPSTSPASAPKTVDAQANTYTPQMPDEIREQNKQDLLRQIREASKYKTSDTLKQEFSSATSHYTSEIPIQDSNKNQRTNPKKDHSKLTKTVIVMAVIIASLFIIVGVIMALTKKNNDLPPLITPKQEQYREKPKPVTDETPQKTARIYADGEGKEMKNRVEHILASPEQPLSLEEMNKGKKKITQENAPDTVGINSHPKDSHGFENEALSNKNKNDINKETTQTLKANANSQDLKPSVVTPSPVSTKAKPSVATSSPVKPIVTKPTTSKVVVKPTVTKPATPKVVENTNVTKSTTPKVVEKPSVATPSVSMPTPTNTDTSKVVAPAPAVTKTPGPTINYKWEVQLMAAGSKRLAEKSWKKAVIKSAGTLTTTPVYRTVIVKKVKYIRLRTGNFKTRRIASQFCAKLKTHGLDCSPTLKK